MPKIYLILILVLLAMVTLSQRGVFSDTVYFDNNKVEGVIVEETPACVVVETPIGKVTIEKDRITNIERTSQEENFLKMGNYYFNQKRYDAAIDYYHKALEVNPQYKEAQEALVKAKKIKEEIDLQRKLELERIKKEKEKKKEELEKKIGMAVDEVEGEFKVVHITKGSLAEAAQIKLYDRIITINDSHTKGMTLEKVWELLSGEKPISLTVEREVSILRKRIEYRKRTFVGIGIFLDTDDEGPFISSVIEGEPADKAGIKSKDRIIKINGKSTEGLSLDKIAKLISDGELTTVYLVIRRDLQIK
jgi:C-terminal processing protease CtpA/Prc